MAGRCEGVSVGAVRCRSILASAAALLLAACGGDDPAPTATPTSGSVVTTTSVQATTTSSPPTSAASSTTAPETTVETTAPTSETATTTTPEGIPQRVTFPDDPEKQAVVDAAYAFFDAARAAQASPDDESLRAALAITMSDPIATVMNDFLDGLLEEGTSVVQGDAPTFLDVVGPTVVAVAQSGTLDACSVDGDVRIRQTDDSIVSENVGSAFVTYSLVEQTDGWRVRNVTVLSRYPGLLQCG